MKRDERKQVVADHTAYSEALDEIATLRAQLDEARQMATEWQDMWRAERERALASEAREARLRSALEKAASRVECDDYDYGCECPGCICRRTLAALNPEEAPDER